MFVPHFYAQIAALNQSVVVGDSILGLVLISIWEQIILYINASIMTINVAVWSLIVLFRIVLPLFAESVSLPWQPGRTLLDMIMHRGKINWIVAHILGYESFEKEMGYSEDEAEWCRKNKTSLWKTMVEMVIYMLPIPLLYVLIYARIPLFLLWVRKLLQVLEYGWGFC